ncbi:DUF2058 domain-containing protein [Agaribacter flavus]|uniref:DUF2058 domain-containing protein n=1 Tax=Agaribacter flavus TaxID=1902781 RepID=A0ABV7FVM9_9ALTE
MAKLSLQDQMLKAGLVNEKKLKKAKKGSKKSRQLAREVKASVEANKSEKAEKDKALNQAQKAELLTKEIKAQIQQLIASNKISVSGELKYNFKDGTLIKSMLVDTITRQQLLNGILAIARENDSYVVIPGVVADKIAARDETQIVEHKVPEEEIPDEDDPYADFVVPDDLMW